MGNISFLCIRAFFHHFQLGSRKSKISKVLRSIRKLHNSMFSSMLSKNLQKFWSISCVDFEIQHMQFFAIFKGTTNLKQVYLVTGSELHDDLGIIRLGKGGTTNLVKKPWCFSIICKNFMLKNSILEVFLTKMTPQTAYIDIDSYTILQRNFNAFKWCRFSVVFACWWVDRTIFMNSRLWRIFRNFQIFPTNRMLYIFLTLQEYFSWPFLANNSKKPHLKL